MALTQTKLTHGLRNIGWNTDTEISATPAELILSGRDVLNRTSLLRALISVIDVTNI